MPNRAERRRNGIRGPKDQQPQQAPQPQLFGLVQVGRAEQVTPDGTKLAVIVFHIVTPGGSLLVENTPGGQVPITIVSQPVAIGKALVLPGMPVARA